MSTQQSATRIKRPILEIGASENKVVEGVKPRMSSNTKTSITFGELCEEGLIKPGMAVKFKRNTFDSITLTHDQTGVKEDQEIKGKLGNGIVIINNDGETFIAVKAFLEKKITLFGRYGRAFGEKTLTDLTFSIGKQVIDCEEYKILLMQKSFYIDYFNNSFLFADYILNTGSCEGFYTTSGYIVNSYTGSISYGIPRLGENTAAHLLIGFNLKSVKCKLKSMKTKQTNKPMSYTNNPFNMFVEFD